MSADDAHAFPVDRNVGEGDGSNQNQRNTDQVFKQPAPQVIEKAQEAKLKAKYPNLKAGGGSALLHKRLQRGTKYFDSGDYNMAKAQLTTTTTTTNTSKRMVTPVDKKVLQESTGDAIPTPENLSARKPSLVQSKLATGQII